ncbi:MAG: hypothetical protein IPK80_20895 [Nannocystis sp.]|nr:hypothetical protein [Nannocystis sp.]
MGRKLDDRRERYVSGQRILQVVAIDTLLADANPNGVLHTGSSTSPYLPR